MKHTLQTLVVAVAALVASCTSSETLTTETQRQQGDTEVTFTLSAPDAMSLTRAALDDRSSARGGITNVDWTRYSLRYRFAIYKDTRTAGAADPLWTLEPGFPKDDVAAGSYSGKSFTAKLTKGATYRVVCWADFVSANTPGQDLHYDTSDLASISAKDEGVNDESRDAYFVSQTIATDDLRTTETQLTLRRPFAKLRLVTSNWGGLGNSPSRFRITYKSGITRFAGLNALTGKPLSSDALSADKPFEADVMQDATNSANDSKYYRLSYDASTQNRTLLIDYLLADNDRADDGSLLPNAPQTPIHFTFQPLDAQGLAAGSEVEVNQSVTHTDPDNQATTITSPVPIRRNYLTTILGNFFEKGQKLKVMVSEGFAGEYVEGEPWWRPTELQPRMPRTTTETSSGAVNPTTGEYDPITVYHVTDINELAWIAEQTSDSWSDITIGDNTVVRLEADLDFNNITSWCGPWIKGSNSMQDQPYTDANGNYHAARPVIDGQGHTIRNFNAKYFPYQNKYQYNQTSVFDQLRYCHVKDLNFENITLRGLHETNRQAEGRSFDLHSIFGYTSGGVELTSVNVKHLFMYVPEIPTPYTYYKFMMIGGMFSRVDGTDCKFDGCSIKDMNVYVPKSVYWGKNTPADETDDFYAAMYFGGFIGYTDTKYMPTINNCSTDRVNVHLDFSGELVALTDLLEMGYFCGHGGQNNQSNVNLTGTCTHTNWKFYDQNGVDLEAMGVDFKLHEGD